MAIYIYSHPNTGEIKEVIQSMNDIHEYIQDGIKWNREFTSPTASIDTKIDPWSQKDFVEKTRNKKGTLGGIWDQSAELSEKRKGASNYDPVKEDNYKNYQKKVGKPHIDKLKQAARSKLDKLGVSIE